MSAIETLKARFNHERHQQEASRLDARGAYEKTVLDSVAGTELDPDEVLTVIKAAGFTFDEFEQHVAQEQHRNGLRELADQLPEFDRKVRENTAKAAELRAEVERVQKSWQARDLELTCEKEALQREHKKLLQAESDLAKLPKLGERLQAQAPRQVGPGNDPFLLAD